MLFPYFLARRKKRKKSCFSSSDTDYILTQFDLKKKKKRPVFTKGLLEKHHDRVPGGCWTSSLVLLCSISLAKWLQHSASISFICEVGIITMSPSVRTWVDQSDNVSEVLIIQCTLSWDSLSFPTVSNDENGGPKSHCTYVCYKNSSVFPFWPLPHHCPLASMLFYSTWNIPAEPVLWDLPKRE